MFRLGLLLAATIYAAMVLLPTGADEGNPSAQTHAQSDTQEPRRTERADPSTMTSLTLTTGETWEIDRVIALQEPASEQSTAGAGPTVGQTGADTGEAQTGTGAAVAAALGQNDAAPATEDSATLLYVTGDRVNLRSGPSTNDPIVRALTRGTATELVAAAEDGWFEIRDTESGDRGFMSGDFLSTEAP
mgnify:CR=1 FL=1